ncbi:hypothetical protein [Symbioplanes lichenis]|uniref:hypothetical protein n=1 Tax=Symbioplanes lichenis TaxID=1629072 RepID=UPI002738324C|nr:hypothetical protein [Actinoplanes lichenis]
MVIVGHDALTLERDAVLVVPLSEVIGASLVQPHLADNAGRPVGVALTPRVGEIAKGYLKAPRGELEAASGESLDIALRAALDL